MHPGLPLSVSKSHREGLALVTSKGLWDMSDFFLKPRGSQRALENSNYLVSSPYTTSWLSWKPEKPGMKQGLALPQRGSHFHDLLDQGQWEELQTKHRGMTNLCGLRAALSGSKACSKLVITWDSGMNSASESQLRNTRLNHLLTIRR